MMSATQVSAGAASSGYYQAEGYYAAGSQEAEQAASWFGRGAQMLGLSGRVDDDLFTRMLDGQTFSNDGGRLAPQRLMGRIRDGEREHRAGLDLTFSAPKSVSIAALVYQDERLIDAHDKAVKAAMAYVQDHLVQTRTHVNGELQVHTGGNIVAGLFRHDTSRLLDPQLHTHAVIANQVYHANGDATAIHNSLIFQAQKLGSEIYRNVLCQEATALGYNVAREGEHRLLVLRDIPENLVTAFSKRSEEMRQALSDRDMPVNAKTAELAALATRAAKHQELDRDSLHRSWTKEAEELGISRASMRETIRGLQAKARFHVPGQTRDGGIDVAAADAHQSLKTAISHVSETRPHYSPMDLTVAALSFATQAGHREITHAIQTAIKSGALSYVKVPGNDDRLLTDAATLQTEREIGVEFRSGAKSVAVRLANYAIRGNDNHISGASGLAKRLKETTLSEGQKDAIEVSLSSEGRVVGVQGSAGTGKTFMLAHLHKEATRAGYDVVGLAPSNEAVTQLKEALPGSETLQSHLLRRGPQADLNPKKTIYVVDEASMIGNGQMRDLLRLTAGAGIARVVLVGDVQQLDSVSAGTPFALLQKMGMPTAVMDDIQRQRNDTALAIVKHAIAGEVKEAFARIGGRLAEVSDPARAVAEHYLGLSESKRQGTGLLTPTNRSREAINEHVRAGLRDEGTLRGSDVELTGLRPVHLSRAQRADPDSYDAGNVVLAHQSYKVAGLTKGHLYEVVERNSADQTITLRDQADGKTTTVPLSQSGKATASIEVFEDRERSFATGDRVKFRITDKTHGIRNGETGLITHITKSTVAVTTSGGGKKVIPHDSLAARGLDHGYALTGHDYQGANVDNIVIAMSSTETLANQKSFYVAVSRARDTATLITDDAAALAQRLERQTGEVIPALEAWLAARLERPQAARDRPPEEQQKDRKAERETDPEQAAAKDPSKEAEKTTEPPFQNGRGARPKEPSGSPMDYYLSTLSKEDRQQVEDIIRERDQKQLGDYER